MDDVPYDEATQRRIDGVVRRRTVRPAPPGRRALGASAMLAAVALGLHEVFDPRERDEIVVEVDTSGPDHDQPVALEFDPTSPARSRAFVRPWLLGAVT